MVSLFQFFSDLHLFIYSIGSYPDSRISCLLTHSWSILTGVGSWNEDSPTCYYCGLREMHPTGRILLPD
jgi:hypothetical protein